MLPENKREFLQELGVDVDELEQTLAQAKAKLDSAGLESKEAGETESVELENEPEKDNEEPEKDIDIKALLDEALGPVFEAIKGLQAANAELEKKMMTPATSLTDLVAKSIIGNEDAAIDGRSALAKDKPREASAADPGARGTGIPFIDAMRAGADWRKALRNQ